MKLGQRGTYILQKFKLEVTYVKNRVHLCSTKHHATKAYWEIGGIALRIL